MRGRPPTQRSLQGYVAQPTWAGAPRGGIVVYEAAAVVWVRPLARPSRRCGQTGADAEPTFLGTLAGTLIAAPLATEAAGGKGVAGRGVQ
jgi:hypothetical protein